MKDQFFAVIDVETTGGGINGNRFTEAKAQEYTIENVFGQHLPQSSKYRQLGSPGNHRRDEEISTKIN